MHTDDSFPRAVRELVAHFKPLIGAIAAIAHGHDQQRAEVEYLLPQLDNNGWKIQAATQRIWAGERDVELLTAGLDQNSSALVRAILASIEAYEHDPEAARIAAVISEWRPIILTVAAAAYDVAQAQEDISGFLPQLEQQAAWQTLAHRIRLLLAGDTNRERLLRELDPIDTVIMSAILHALEDPENLQRMLEQERQQTHEE